MIIGQTLYIQILSAYCKSKVGAAVASKLLKTIVKKNNGSVFLLLWSTLLSSSVGIVANFAPKGGMHTLVSYCF